MQCSCMVLNRLNYLMMICHVASPRCRAPPKLQPTSGRDRWWRQQWQSYAVKRKWHLQDSANDCDAKWLLNSLKVTMNFPFSHLFSEHWVIFVAEHFGILVDIKSRKDFNRRWQSIVGAVSLSFRSRWSITCRWFVTFVVCQHAQSNVALIVYGGGVRKLVSWKLHSCLCSITIVVEWTDNLQTKRFWRYWTNLRYTLKVFYSHLDPTDNHCGRADAAHRCQLHHALNSR